MGNKRLLLIEDDYDVAEMLLLYFKSHDFEVIHADNGTDGVEIARTQFPNLILLDVMLPDMDGYDVCVKLRRSAMTKYIPTLFLTQRDERASKVRGLELGADDYITKPFDIDELRLRVQGSIHRATRENLHETRTGLPTGTMVEEEQASKEASGKAFHKLLFTINGFSAYNDKYGFVAGNDVLNYAGSIIHKTVSQLGTPDDFLGVIGDDFVIMTHVEDAKKLETTAIDQFNQEVKAFYAFMDVEAGGIMVNENTADAKLIPFMTMTCTTTDYTPAKK
ncbi:MAG TPA: response regulator [Aggregatilineales bacterium]|nr:response regulator [Aggregatilineales bacterium]